MNEFVLYALAGIAGLTSLTVQALKKLLDEKDVSYLSCPLRLDLTK